MVLWSSSPSRRLRIPTGLLVAIVFCAGCLLPSVDSSQRTDGGASTSSSARGQPDGSKTAVSERDASTGSGGTGGDNAAVSGKGALAGSGGQSGAAGSGGEPAVQDSVRVGDPCSKAGALACTHPGSFDRLKCDGSTWTKGDTCEIGFRCNTEDETQIGACLRTELECQGKTASVPYCASSVIVRVCGPDLVSSHNVTVCELPTPNCVDGACACENLCDGTCRDVQSDSEHCGSCGNRCRDAACVSGECRAVRFARDDSPASVRSQLAQDGTHLYWTGGAGVMSASKSDGTTSTLVRRNMTGGGIVIDAAFVYWSDINSGVISKVPIAGGSPIELATHEDLKSDFLAIDAKYIYALYQYGGGGIRRVPLSGGTPELFAAEQGIVESIVVDSQFVYWTSRRELDAAIMKAPTAGGPPEMVASVVGESSCITLANNELFWIQGTSVMKLSTAGGQPAMLAPTGGASALAADSSNVFVAAQNLLKVSISNGNVESLVRVDKYAFGLIVDDTSLYWFGRDGIYRLRK